ncbi:MAG: glutamate--tRNA ligase [Tissierellia bacterium]|nr:glutamate--tRNA ligase [Tissierellia bacterium]
MSNTKKQVVTRMAPSPTGEMHIGNLRTALYSWLYAKQNNGKFILRIEDTDKKRSKTKHIKEIMSTLETFGLNWDEYYRQSERLGLYQHYAHKLVNNGSAYICQCGKDSEECKCNLTNNPYVSKSYCIKLRVKDSEAYYITCKDELRGTIKYNTKELYDIVLLKADGYPTYHLASIVDDGLMGVTDVFRGNEWLSSFPYHKLIYNALGFCIPKFYHLSLICNEEGKKLSKRDGDFSVKSLLDKGYLPSTLLNYIALLGWHPSGNKEVFSRDELISEFDITRLNTSASSFDEKKLRNLNLKISRTDYGIAEAKQYISGLFTPMSNPTEQYIILDRLLSIYQTGIDVRDLFTKLRTTSQNIDIYPERAKFYVDLLSQIYTVRSSIPDMNTLLDETEIAAILGNLKSQGYSNKVIHEYIRLCTTGCSTGLPAEILLSIITPLGLDKALQPYRLGMRA